jgi:hypothetical protein
MAVAAKVEKLGGGRPGAYVLMSCLHGQTVAHGSSLADWGILHLLQVSFS